MRVIIIGGFLGSGKTTLLLQIAQRLSAASKKTAIIENELGEFGVDGEYLALEGLQVRQLYGGCVCCTLSSGLVETLEDLERNFRPDTVILEATGAADPGAIASGFGDCRFEIQGATIISLVDAQRYEMLMKMMSPLLTSQIRAADIVVLSKIDRVAPETADHIVREIRGMNDSGEVYPMSLEGRTELAALMDRIDR